MSLYEYDRLFGVFFGRACRKFMRIVYDSPNKLCLAYFNKLVKEVYGNISF